jgi:hypothetical protein
VSAPPEMTAPQPEGTGGGREGNNSVREIVALSASTVPQPMSRADREQLSRLIRQQARLGKTQAAQRAAELRADLEQQLDARYPFDKDTVWGAAYGAARRIVAEGNAGIAQRCEELGIPAEYRPSIVMGWLEQGRNILKGERTDMRRVGHAQIDALEKLARTEIERVALQLETELVDGR